ncbi:coiled-coil domain-containing protein [Ureaplasma zalophigenitalium]|uniref:Lipoprotein n=1 Tax=Ureaplasma zalophigenitalium TaxID=907723 RepID=A0ABT3BPS0_9BACT|nr:hypothetical protein [Ureaplasma zalophigenitalium]MCV3754229.1 hypothetical protein [Ureaplasma zalophigenitalium]
MKFKRKTKVITYLSLATLPILTIPLAAFACKQTDNFATQVDQHFARLVKRIQDKKYKSEAEINQINQEIYSLQKKYKEASDDSIKHTVKQEMENYLAKLQKDIKEQEYQNSTLALNLVADYRFNNPDNPYTKTQKIDNQVINGSVLNVNANNSLMCFDWLVLSDTNNYHHDHSHQLDKYETSLVQNKKGDISVLNFANNDPFISQTTGIFNGLEINDSLYQMTKFGVDKVQLRIDGIGAYTNAEPIKEIDNNLVLNSMSFRINDLAYLTNKQAIRITAISFQHTHSDNIYNQWTIQFKDPIVVKIK